MQESGHTLRIAPSAGRLEIAQKLVNCGVGVCARTKDGSTPLRCATVFGQSQVLEILVKVRCHPGDGPAGYPCSMPGPVLANVHSASGDRCLSPPPATCDGHAARQPAHDHECGSADGVASRPARNPPRTSSDGSRLQPVKKKPSPKFFLAVHQVSAPRTGPRRTRLSCRRKGKPASEAREREASGGGRPTRPRIEHPGGLEAAGREGPARSTRQRLESR